MAKYLKGREGCFLLKKIGEDKILRHGTICSQPQIPASSFKIPNTLIGLETGAITPTTVVKWDQKPKFIKDWEQDLDLATAFKVSSVPYYQELARRVGPTKMKEMLDKFAYGNRLAGESVDTFWLQGPLLITPEEQLDFMERLVRGKLPVKPAHLQVLRRIMIHEERQGRIFRGKTGSERRDDKFISGWFVGDLETAGEQWIFVAYLRGDGAKGPEAKEIVSSVLRELAL